MVRLLAAACLVLTMTPPALAQDAWCEDWWFARNLIFDRAGQCFASPLGQALFDNTDCTTRNPVLDREAAEIVAQIRALETENACAVDTGRTALTYPETLEPYRAMLDIPVRDMGESGCLGYRGAPVAILAGARPEAAVIGWLEPGMSVGFAHVGRRGYDYVQVFPVAGSIDGGFSGWAVIGPDPLPCDGYAG